ncbi:MAG: carboxylesterase/lipase family protein [Solobacterium sp.]|nr:carboxylesterase/lipase family protein [Solobacterium sp.]
MEFICTSTEPVVQTKAGKVHGYKLDGIYTFKGIPYATARRFHMPEPYAPWEGIKDTIAYGDTAPYMEKKVNGFNDVRIAHRYWPQDEACQYINVWTKALDTTAKMPVMVWIHGGGFDTGSSVELVCYEGANAARYGDVVLVSLNHRLNIAGYLDLSAYGEEYKNSGNSGMADIVMALEWVRDNIAEFGGDPENVTIFGQSGGGGKVTTLLQMPAADGLFHKAIIQSGVLYGGPSVTKQSAQDIADMLVKQLGLTRETIHKIEEIPYSEIVDAYAAIRPQINAKGYRASFAPVPGDYYAGSPLETGFTEHACGVPVMIGSTFGEIPNPHFPKKKYEKSEEECLAILRETYGDQTEEIVSEFRKAYPDKNLLDILLADIRFRLGNIKMLDIHAKQASAPAYGYMFAYDFPYNDGEPAWHCAELPFVFHNIELVPVCHIPEDGERLQNEFFGAWTAFARTGNPNNEHLPQWDPYTEGNEITMIFDSPSTAKKDYDRNLVNLVAKVNGKLDFVK